MTQAEYLHEKFHPSSIFIFQDQIKVVYCCSQTFSRKFHQKCILSY